MKEGRSRSGTAAGVPPAGGSLLARVAGTAQRHAMFEAGQTVGVAVSGGPDSICLLHVLVALAPRWNLRLHVLHVDHRLRTGSEADAGFVRGVAEALSVPFTCEVARLGGGNLEQAARHARREFFLSIIRDGIANRIAIGHTRSDQAETVLFRFLRGSAAGGLSGIWPVTAEGFVRPLIEVSRGDVLAFLQAQALPFRNDPMNHSRQFARNRLRHEWLPALVHDWNPALEQILAQTAEWARGEEEWWRIEIDRLAASLVRNESGSVLMNTGKLAELPVAAARRLVRRAIAEVKGDLRAIDFPHVEAVLALANRETGDGHVHLPGVDASRSFDWLRIAKRSPEMPAYRRALLIPGRTVVPGGVITTEIIENPSAANGEECRYNGTVCRLDWAKTAGPIDVRSWEPGDRYHAKGHAGIEKLRDLFQKAKIPSWRREGWPVAVRAEQIVWVRHFGPAAGVAASAKSTRILVIRDECFDGINERQGDV